MITLRPLILIAVVGVVLIIQEVVFFTPVFSQTTTSTMDGSGTTKTTTSPESYTQSLVESLSKSLGALGILAWYLWYHESKRMPAKDRQISDSIDKFSLSLDKIIEANKIVNDNLILQIQRHSDMLMQVVQKCSGKGA